MNLITAVVIAVSPPTADVRPDGASGVLQAVAIAHHVTDAPALAPADRVLVAVSPDGIAIIIGRFTP